METDKPLISILMAIYEPRMDWLREQLLSLNAQTYPNLRLYIRDDCSPTVSYEEIQSCVKDCISAFPYEIQRNEKNLGSNGTFERLTAEADGEYFAYCDQDDVWLPHKLEILQEKAEKNGAILVCSDVKIIDGDGNETASSITQVRHRHVFCSGPEAYSALLTRNFVIGCTMLITSKIAKQAIPFLNEMVHDHWLALYAATKGIVLSIQEPLIAYRIHGGNQTGVLVGVIDKETYIEKRINCFRERVRHVASRVPSTPMLNEVSAWAEARFKFANNGRGAAAVLWKYRACNFPTTIFELCALKLPEFLFRIALKMAKKSG